VKGKDVIPVRGGTLRLFHEAVMIPEAMTQAQLFERLCDAHGPVLVPLTKAMKSAEGQMHYGLGEEGMATTGKMKKWLETHVQHKLDMDGMTKGRKATSLIAYPLVD
jgi:hypothetical protein